MTYELIFGEYSSSPSSLIESINNWDDVDLLSSRVRTRLGGGEEAVKDRQLTIEKLEQWIREARSSGRLQSALKYAQEAAEFRGAFSEQLLREMIEIYTELGQFQDAIAYCFLAKIYYAIEPDQFLFSDEKIEELYEQIDCGPEKSFESAVANLSSLSSENLFPLFDFLFCVENKRRGVLSYGQKSAFLSEISKNSAVMTIFREANFSKMTLDDLHLVISFLTIVRRLGEDMNSMKIGWFSKLIFSLNENAVSNEALKRLSRGVPGSYDRFYGEILNPLYADFAKQNLPRFYFDLTWYSNVGVMFLVWPKDANLGALEQMGAMEWSTMQGGKLLEIVLQNGDSIEHDLEIFVGHNLDGARKTFDIFALVLAASFAEWKCVLAEPRASNEERQRNRTAPIFKQLIPFFDVLTHGHVMGPPLSTLIREHLLSLNLQFSKQVLFFARNLANLTDLSRKTLFPESIRYIFQTLTFSRTRADLAPILNFKPFCDRFIEASPLVFGASPKSLVKSEIFDQFMLITGRLGSASPRFLEKTFPFASAFFHRYKHEDALHCIVQTLRSAPREKLITWASENGELFSKIASHFYRSLMSQINNLLQAERIIDFLLAINTLIGLKLVPASEVFGHLSSERLVFVDKLTALILGRGYDSDETYAFFRPFLTVLRPIAVVTAGLTLATLCREDEKCRQLCLKNKNRPRAAKKMRQEIENFAKNSS